MIYNEHMLQLIWIIIFSAILIVFAAIILRCIFLYLLEKNVCNLQTIFSNTRILQTAKEKKICNALDVSLQKTFKESNIHRILPVLPQFIASSRTTDAAPSEAENHWPLFQVAVNGKILNPELLIATRAPEYSTVIGTLCIASIASNMTVINFTMICMAPKTNTSELPMTDASVVNLAYDNKQKSIIMWAAAVGTLAAAWPFHWFYQQFGARSVFFFAGAVSTLSTALMPLAAHLHFNFLVIARFFQGVSFGADFAAIGLIVVNWASLKQHGLFISLLSSFSQISVMFTMPVAGELCESSWGWESVYYVHAVLSGVLFSLWWWFYRNNPTKHPKMTEIELEKIHRGKGDVQAHEKAPIAKILTNSVMLAVWLSAFGELMMSQFIVMYGPTFLKEVLGFAVNHTGYFVAVPRALHLAFKIISGVASDRIHFWSEKTKMRIFNTIALMVSGAFFCILGYLPKDQAHLSLIALLVIECSTGFICGGFYKCATLVARQHSHFVLSQIQFIKCLSLFIEPLLVFLICTHNTLEEWRIVFLTHGVLLIVGNIIFCYYATDEPADFTHLPQAPNGEEMADVPPERRRLTENEA